MLNTPSQGSLGDGNRRNDWLAPNSIDYWVEQISQLAREFAQRQARQKEPLPMGVLIESLETMIIREALRICDGSQKAAAMRLGTKYTTLHEKVKRYGIQPKNLQ